jgi:hypothetical protein
MEDFPVDVANNKEDIQSLKKIVWAEKKSQTKIFES